MTGLERALLARMSFGPVDLSQYPHRRILAHCATSGWITPIVGRLGHYRLTRVGQKALSAAPITEYAVEKAKKAAMLKRLAQMRPAPPSSSQWPQERADELQRLVSEGATFLAIAEQLGITKNSAIGKAHRMGFTRAPDAQLNDMQLSRVEAEKTRAAKAAPLPSEFPDRGCCVFPVGHVGEPGFHFCGEKVAIAGAPYCGPHLRITHVAVKVAA